MLPTPEFIEKDTKRLTTRYKIINEIVQTENIFLQDMIVLEEGYNAFCFECPVITSRQKQTMFGRTNNVVSFSNVFYKSLRTAAGNYFDLQEDQIMEARFEELIKWDANTSVGETFWCSVVPIQMLLIFRWCELKRRILDIVYTKKRHHKCYKSSRKTRQ